MIYDLIKFDIEQQQEKGETNSDALGETHFQAELIINEDGSFREINIFEKKNDRTYREAGGRTSGVRAFLLLDNATYTLGQEKNGTFAQVEDEGYAADRLRAYIERLKEFEHVQSIKSVLLFYEGNRENGLQAAKRSLSEEDIEKLKGGMNIAFRLPQAGQYIHQCDDVVQALQDIYQKNIQKDLKENQYCSLCGKNDSPIVDEPHGGIKGIPGGLSTGCMLVSYNKSSFLSYGLDRNLNSSICKRCAKSYTRALNTLVNERETIRVKTEEDEEEKTIERRKYAEKISGDTLLIFWCKNKEASKYVHVVADPLSEEDFVRQLLEPGEKKPSTLGEAQNFASAPKYNPHKNADKVNTEDFYACVLAAAAGRIAVKDWMHTTLDRVKTNVQQWFNDIDLFTGNKDNNFFYSISRLINFKHSSNDKNDARAGQLLWRAALMGESLAQGLLAPILHSVRMSVIKGENIAPRISLIKAILNRNRNLEKGDMELEKELNENEKNKAYICGRIFSVFEVVQDTLGERNAGIIQRFFSAASSSPAVAFSRLFKLNMHHLEKLSKENKGRAIHWEKRLGELCEKIENSFPEKLALKDQGYFALGYYHEKQARFKKNEKEEDKKNE